MAFFQRATEYPCLLILDPQNEYETLRRRVEQTTLKAQTVDRNRSGVTNVSVWAGCVLGGDGCWLGWGGGWLNRAWGRTYTWQCLLIKTSGIK